MAWIRAVLILAAVCLLPGCWDIKTIQDINYVTAMGIDYKDGQFEVYMQLLDFSSVAKQQGGKPSHPVPIWVGKGSGPTTQLAVKQIYQEAQQKIFYGHTNAIVISESVLKKGIGDILDGYVRERETRYNAWVFGTREGIDDVFTTHPFFNLSPVSSILHDPNADFKDRLSIMPLKYQKFMAQLKEPGNTVLLPSISVDSKVWKNDKKPDPKLKVDGVFALRRTAYMGWFQTEEIQGVKWTQPNMYDAPIDLERDGKHAAAVYLHDLKRSFTIDTRGGDTKFNLYLIAKARVADVYGDVSESFLVEESQRRIKEEVTDTFKTGLDRKTDLYQLEHVLYHDRFPLWAKVTGNGDRPMGRLSLGTIQVNVKIENSGMYKLKKDSNGRVDY